MATLESAQTALDEAQQAQREARTSVEQATEQATDMQRRLKAGDTSVTAKKLAEADDSARHAALLAESHAERVERARLTVEQAKLDEAAQRLVTVQQQVSDLLDRRAPTVVSGLAELLGALSAAREAVDRDASVVGAIDRADTTRPDGVRAARANTARGWESHVALPNVDQLVGELLSAAADRAWPSPRERRGRLGDSRTGSLAAHGSRPSFVTAERAQ